MGALDIAQYLLSFGLVIGLLLGLLWVLKRFQNHGGLNLSKHDSRMKIIESTSVGGRQKVVLLRVDQCDIVLGVTPNGITPLHVLEGNPNTTQEWLRRRQS